WQNSNRAEAHVGKPRPDWLPQGAPREPGCLDPKVARRISDDRRLTVNQRDRLEWVGRYGWRVLGEALASEAWGRRSAHSVATRPQALDPKTVSRGTSSL